MSEISTEVMEVVERVRPLLAGRKPEVQGAALAELLATFICGIQALGDAEATTVVQAAALNMHIDMVRLLIASGTCYPKGGQN